MASTTAPNPVPDQRKIGMDSLLLRILQIYNTIADQFLIEKRIGLKNFKCHLYEYWTFRSGELFDLLGSKLSSVNN